MTLKPKVYIASPVGKSKSYTSNILPQVAFCEEIRFFEDTSPDDWNVVSRIAKVREEIRQAFLKSDCTHLYFHDADMLPPSDIVERLLAHDRYIASGVYLIRGLTEPIAPVMMTLTQGRYGVHLGQSGVFTGGDAQEVIGVGMGCMLIRREVLESVGFEKPEHYTHEVLSEDYQFCLDAQSAGFTKPLVDLALPCWHIDSDGNGTCPVIGGEVYSASYIGDNGAVRNNYGYWEKGIPKPMAQEDASKLNYEFWHGYARSVKVIREKKL